jgi:hypothetical protein
MAPTQLLVPIIGPTIRHFPLCETLTTKSLNCHLQSVIILTIAKRVCRNIPIDHLPPKDHHISQISHHPHAFSPPHIAILPHRENPRLTSPLLMNLLSTTSLRIARRVTILHQFSSANRTVNLQTQHITYRIKAAVVVIKRKLAASTSLELSNSSVAFSDMWTWNVRSR